MNNYQTVRLGDVCEIARGGSPRPISDYITTAEDGINWIKIGDTSSDSKYIEHTEQKIKPEGMKKSRYVHSGDFILSNSMSFGRPYILKIDGCIHDGWLVLQNIQNDIDKDYLYSVLSSPSAYHQFEKMAVGGVVNNLNSDKVKELIFPLPPLSEQKYIASVLDKCTEVIAKHREILDKYDTLVKSRFIEMFGDPVTNPMGWEVKKLGELTRIGSSKRIFEKEYVSEGVPFFRTKEIVELSKGNPITTELFISKERYEEIKQQFGIPKKNDLLVSAVGTIGIIWIVDGKQEFYFKDGNLIRIETSKYFDSVYLKMQLEALISEFKKKMNSGTAYSALTISGLCSMSVPVPPIDLQEKFAEFVRAVDAQKAKAQKSLDKAETLYKALMQEYFEA